MSQVPVRPNYTAGFFFKALSCLLMAAAWPLWASAEPEGESTYPAEARPDVFSVAVTDGIVVTASNNVVCFNGSTTLTAEGGTGLPGCNLQWQLATTPEGPWTTIAGATGSSYTPPINFAGTRFFRAICCPHTNFGPYSFFTLYAGNALGAGINQQVCIDITTANFSNILGMHFSMSYNPLQLQFVSVSNFGLPGFSLSNFGLPVPGGASITAPGSISVAWGDPDLNGEHLPDGAVLFRLCFNALTSFGSSTVHFSSNPAPIEIINASMQNVPYVSVPGTIRFNTPCPSPLVSNTVSIHAKPSPYVQVSGGTTVCQGRDWRVHASGASGVGECSYQWYDAPSPNGPWTLIDGVSGGSYTVPTNEIGVRYYRAVYSCDGDGCEAGTSNAVAVTVTPSDLDPVLSPSSLEVCAGGPATLSVTTSGSNECTRFWQRSANGIDGWTPINGVTSATFNPPTSTPGTTYYRVRFACGSLSSCNSDTSNVVPVTVTPGPPVTVTVTPGIAAVCLGGEGPLLSVDFSGMSGCVVQWQVSPFWTNIPGATGMTYRPPASSLGILNYRARVTCFDGTCGGAFFSNSVNVSVFDASRASITPAVDKAICIGGTARYTATLGGGVTCPIQWLAAESPDGPWTPVPGATSGIFSAPAGTLGRTYYSVAPACYQGSCPLPLSNVVSVVVEEHVEPVVLLESLSALCYDQPGVVRATVTNAGDNFKICTESGSVCAANIPWGFPINLGPLPPGEHCFVISGNNGCEQTEGFCATLEPVPPPISVTAVINPSSCASTPDGSMELTVAGGVPPYTIVWNGDTIPDGHISGLTAGAYLLSVTDANGCVSAPQFVVGSMLQADAGPDRLLDCYTPELALTGSASISGDHIGYAWFAPNGAMVGNSPSLTVNQGGLYRFRVINSALSGCFSEDSVWITDPRHFLPDEISATLIACNTSQLSAPPSAGYSGPIDFEWTLPDGSLSTDTLITAVQTGIYQLRSSIPGSGCEAVLSRFIDAGADACASLRGRVVYDTEENCQAEADEEGLAYWIVRAVGAAGTFYRITDTAGMYYFSLPLGAYTLSVVPASLSWIPCEAFFPVALDEEGQTHELDIPVQFVVLCPELEVQLSAPFLRRCFASNYQISVCNMGTETISDPRIWLQLDDYLQFVASEYIPDSINGQTIAWTLPALWPSNCLQFSVWVVVSCDAEPGQAHCSTAGVLPNEICTPAPSGWSGASIEVSGECAGEAILFRVRNAGPGDLTDPVQYIVIEDVVMLMQMPNTIDNLPSGAEQVFEFPANGSTWFFSVEQAPLHPFGNPVTVAVEGCGTNDAGTFSTGFVNQLPLQTATPATYVLCMPNVGAYDPNDKQAIPIGYGPEHFVRAGDPLHYQIRFQNTGTDTAFTVIIRDTLSPWLDISTLRPGPSSHAYRLDIAGERTLVFTFNNILLPDSTTNLEASQGFVDFFIRIAEDAPLDTRIENSAGIYFDFNEPVITNTVFHTIGRDFIPTATAVFQPHPGYKWQLFPNPATDEAWLISDQLIPGRKTAWLYDALGRPLRQIPFEGERCLLQFRGLAPGWYALRIVDAGGRSVGTARVVIR